MKIGEEDTGQYFDKWARKFEAKVLVKLRGRDQTILDWSPRYKRIILSPLDIELFKGFNEKRFLFPMYVDIEFSTDRRTLLADAIKESQLGTSLMKAVMEPVQQGANDEKYRPRWSWFKIATETITGTGASDKIVEVSVPQRKVVLDIVDWWTAFKNRATSNTRKSVVLGTSLPEIFVSDDQQYRFVQTILSLIFSGKIRETLRGRLRTFEDIMNGKHAYSETIFYKISKHHRNFITNLPEISSIQDFYVPNSSELDLFKFVDTQVAFGKKYVYIVSAYEMVFGTAYQYRQPSADARNAFGVWNDAALIDVYTRPSIQLIETPILMFDTQVSDKSPLPPQVDIIPYRNVNNEILINLSVNSGELTAQPIAFNALEKEKHDELRRIHDLEPDGPLEFKGDDPIDYFEVYRTTFKPRSYEDFANQFHLQVDTEILNPTGKQISIAALSSASVIDSIRPNVKYYYTFRAFDIRGNISNPSEVFRFEMVENSGVLYPVLEVVSFDSLKKKEENRNFKSIFTFHRLQYSRK